MFVPVVLALVGCGGGGRTTTGSTAATVTAPPQVEADRTEARMRNQKPSTAPPVAGEPVIVQSPIPFGAERQAEAAAYSLRHYGIRSSRLEPRVIVLHFTETDSYQPVRNAFASNRPAAGPSGSSPESPGTCAHFVIEQNGTIHQLVPLTIQCRHTIGLNRWAIGIEMVQATHGHSSRWADQQILNRPAQVEAALALVRSLQRRFVISTANVVGHATANSHPLFRDLAGWKNDHTDWGQQDIVTFRRRLRG